MQSPHDVISLIKKYISDSELSQPPLLVLTHQRAQAQTLVPGTKTLDSKWFSKPSLILRKPLLGFLIWGPMDGDKDTKVFKLVVFKDQKEWLLLVFMSCHLKNCWVLPVVMFLLGFHHNDEYLGFMIII
jgi:hypothetical protein